MGGLFSFALPGAAPELPQGGPKIAHRFIGGETRRNSGRAPPRAKETFLDQVDSMWSRRGCAYLVVDTICISPLSRNISAGERKIFSLTGGPMACRPTV